MSEAKAYYSPDEAAALLGLHVRTVRRFIREGRLKAAQVGRQYRIASGDLKQLAGATDQDSPAPPARRRRMVASTTIDIDGIEEDEQERLVTLLLGAFQSVNGAQGHGRFDSIYDAEEGRLRILINASLDATNTVLGLIRSVLEE